ncbi:MULTISPECIES: serpin family protein [unclassified Leptolyngbya]|uniref:serpin family protein n=1 Tax=unclassified Leptolyngbya TaxID=2650499 RepID=UPI00168679DF|nr:MULTISPECIES: serpin family protein [unclassified Leptolyngbya]MBD1912273.1 serpin family protein [Leptolyngbya sp. FACHB-8]MBD2153842.1 serpin family protein [Leptolyngbya sp. FACHB-16]
MRQLQRTKQVLLSSLVLVGLLGCAMTGGWAEGVGRSPSQNPEVSQRVAPENLPALDDRLVASQNAFGFKLFSQVMQQADGQNVMISPSSVAIALSMTYNGASGETQQAMARVLELQGMSLEDLNQANAALDTILENADPDVKIGIANSLWGREDFTFNPDFLQRNQDYYRAEVQSMDFADPNATDTINEWVSDSTEGKIPKIVEQIRPEEVLFLVNAVYFKGTWTDPFSRRQTQRQPFYRADGSQMTVPMMTKNGEFRYLQTDQFQGIHLPYGDGRLSMVVLLPRDGSSLEALQQSLTPQNWQTWMNRFAQQPGMIQLPRFESEFGTGLNDALTALGMDVAFDPDAADFSGMGDAQLYISDVQHKTYIKVDEEGTEAAAATSVGIGVTSLPVNPPFRMVCDRPFLYAIQDNETGAILFMGVMMNPSGS